jgi:methylaspartate mutase epsilon subunit
MGPRGISVLERLAVRAAEHPNRSVRVFVIDRIEVGAGRVWRTDQPDWLTMNTVAGQVTMYSGGRDGGPDRAGHGPSLDQWLAEGPDPDLAAIGPDGYAPRVAYGRYLREVYRNVRGCLPASMWVEPITGDVVAVRRLDDRSFSLQIETTPYARIVGVDHVVLTTGHPLVEPSGAEQALARQAARHPRLRFLAGDSAADLPLEHIGQGETVGVIGMGLTFYDILLTLTVGRGGRFGQDEDGLRYIASGREPHIVAGSRSGLPIAARGTNQKRPDHVHSPVVFTADRVRAHRDAVDGPGTPMDFRRHIMPFIQAEIDHAYLTLLVRDARGSTAAERFAAQHSVLLAAGLPTGSLRRLFGLSEDATLDLDALARPFAGTTFASQEHFHRALLDLMRIDIAAARRGTLHSPVKASLDLLRDIRNTVRDLVDFGGLNPESHRDDFLGWYAPINALLSAGPPVERSEQLVALIKAGVVAVIGPHARFSVDPSRRAFVIRSPDVAGSGTQATALVDARIPQPNLRRDASPLYRQLLADGTAREFVIPGGGVNVTAPISGLEVTRAPYRAVDLSGQAVPGLYALGLPTEHLRWFNQIGNGRPGLKTLFLRDADTIAEAILAEASAGVEADTAVYVATPV